MGDEAQQDLALTVRPMPPYHRPAMTAAVSPVAAPPAAPPEGVASDVEKLDVENSGSDTSPAADEQRTRTGEADERESRAAASLASRWFDRPWVLALAGGVLLFASFYPLDLGFLAWLALVPAIRLALLPELTRRRRLLAAWGLGLIFAVPSLQWMRLASPPMLFAWLALAAYVAGYVPAFVALVRAGHVRLRWPLPLVAAIAWAGLELLRGHLMTGFAWYYLGHSQHRWTSLCQIADLGGAPLISFLVAGWAGVIAMLWPVGPPAPAESSTAAESNTASAARLPSRRGVVAWAGAWAALVALACGYGAWRVSQAELTAGPRVALVQGNFPSSLKHDPEQFGRILQVHRDLTAASIPHHPDLILWPETMLRYPLLEADDALALEQRQRLAPYVDPSAWNRPENGEALRDLAAASSADLLLGGEVWTLNPERAVDGGLRRYNAAISVTPETGVGSWYGKRHRVPFGEYPPLAEHVPAVAAWLESIGVPNINAGRDSVAFTLADTRTLPLICFEDTVPHLVREMVAEQNAAGQPVQLLANLTNDGWFHGSAELDQHLVTARFRCIETRTPMVRAVNTGISAVIDSHGVVREPAVALGLDGEPLRVRDETGRFRRQFDGVLIADVPLDERGSVYLRVGDSFGWLCVLAIGVMTVGGWRRSRVTTAETS